MYRFNYIKDEQEFLFSINIDLKDTDYELIYGLRGNIVSYDQKLNQLKFNLQFDLDEFVFDGRQYETASIIYNGTFDLNKDEVMDCSYDIYVYKARQDVISAIEKNLKQHAIFKIRMIK